MDVLSGGRLDLGLGLGWMPEEFTRRRAAIMAGRGARTAEYIEVMRHLWAGGVAEFSGEFYTRAGLAGWRRSRCSGPAPDPARRDGSRALERAGRLADGWVTSSRTDLSQIGEGIKTVAGRGAAGRPRPGRDPDHLPRAWSAGARR